MLGITRLLLGFVLVAVMATPAMAQALTGLLQGKEKLKVKGCGSDQEEGPLEIDLFLGRIWEAVNAQATHYSGTFVETGKGNIALTFDADSLDLLFDNLTARAGDICGFPVSILSATQNTFTGKFAKGKAKGTVKFSFLGEAFDGTPGTATWTAKYKGGYILQP